MFKDLRNSHELSECHYRQVLCRPRALREQMHRIWGITCARATGAAAFSENCSGRWAAR